MSRASAEINLSAIAQNFKSIKSRTTADVLAVVKADAYGHGLIPVSKALEELVLIGLVLPYLKRQLIFAKLEY